MRERDAGDSAAALALLHHVRDALRFRRARIDHPRGRSHDPRVRARQRHRSSVRRAHERDALGNSFCDHGHGSSIGQAVGSAL